MTTARTPAGPLESRDSTPTPVVADEDLLLRRRVREALQTDRLPPRAPDRTWGGPGSGAACVICERIVSPDEVGLDLEYEQTGGTVSHPAHARCFLALETVLRERQLPPKAAAMPVPLRESE